jgi:hypothetical protein
MAMITTGGRRGTREIVRVACAYFRRHFFGRFR